MMDSPLASILGFSLLVVLFVTFGFVCAEDGHRNCLETVGARPCIDGTVEYDGEGECECATRFGELEWDIYQGCDMD